VQRLRELFPTAKVLMDSEANEATIDALRRSGDLGQFRYLHFATHGKGNNTTAFESKLILSQDQPKSEIKPGEPWYNNEVSAREVLDFWKLNADLVTLSACQTGLGRQGGGEGLLGFAQSFLLSGSRSVCLSLWEVDDIATALLMQRFYQNLLGEREGLSAPMPKALALAEAKDWLRNLTAKEATALDGEADGWCVSR
jgi:CHAT domain-containing protein